jgi:hypothetical protein
MTPNRILHPAVLFCALTLFTLLPVTRCQALITGFNDIDYWVGSGTNQAALVIDWNDGISPVSLAWGFQWDGIATGEDMIQAIAGTTLGDVSATGADSRLTIYITAFGFGNAIDRIAYNGDGFTHDSAGFLSGGYWEYYNMGGTFDTPPDGDPNVFAGSDSLPGTGGAPDWISSWTGFSARELGDGSWDGWSFAPDFVSQGVEVPVAAVPEPGTLILSVFAAGFLASRRRPRTTA